MPNLDELNDINNWSDVTNFVIDILAENTSLKLQNQQLVEEIEELKEQLNIEIDDFK